MHEMLAAALLAAASSGGLVADDLFWSADPVEALDQVAQERGLSLFAPREVDLAARETLPVVLRRRVTMAEDAAAPLPISGVVIAMDVARNEIHAGFAAIRGDDTPAWQPPDPQAIAGMRGTTTQPMLVDLRAALGLPWRPAHLLVLAVARALHSQPARV